MIRGLNKLNKLSSSILSTNKIIYNSSKSYIIAKSHINNNSSINNSISGIFIGSNINNGNGVRRFYCSNNNNNNNNNSDSDNNSNEDTVRDLFNSLDSTPKKERSIFIQTETTPNPDSLKFIPGVQVLPEGQIMDFPDFKSSQNSPLANTLFKIEGVNRVFFTSEFISVNKFPEHDWVILKPEVYGAIIDFFHSGLPILKDSSVGDINTDTTILPEDSEVVAMIKELIETRIRPTVLEDGGNIKYMGFADGIVLVQLQGTCSSCSSSQATLKGGIERMLMHWIAEVRGVVAVSDDELDGLNLEYFKTVDNTIQNGEKKE